MKLNPGQELLLAGVFIWSAAAQGVAVAQG
jgi:hypothetical protein